jgi:hypothetical protein
MAVPVQRTAQRRTPHRHLWALIERVMGFDVLMCTCGERKFKRVKTRQLELFEV